jgi:Glycosyltransferase WbsX
MTVFEIKAVSRIQNRIDVILKHKEGKSPIFYRLDLLLNNIDVACKIRNISKNLNTDEETEINFDFSNFNYREKIVNYLKDNVNKLEEIYDENTCPIYINVSSFSSEKGIHKHRVPILFPEKQHLKWSDILFEFFDFDPRLQRYFDINSTITSRITPKPEIYHKQALPIAFYLPQFYPTKENDEWWGPGYTEWTGVVTNKSQFKSHISPNIPSDLGFYDTRMMETRRKQGELAKDFGIFGFCYYFYWFSGRRVLEAPLEQILKDKEPDLPFCLCWANETWSRRWDGSEAEVLISQNHDIDIDVNIIDDLMPFFRDERYIKIDNKPLLLIYRINLMENPNDFIRYLRDRAETKGLPGLYICSVMSFGHTDGRNFSCDASVEFPPHNVSANEIDVKKIDTKSDFEGKIYDYEDLVSKSIIRPDLDFPYFPGVMPRWDNSARRGSKANIFINSSPEKFAAWVADACDRTERLNNDMPFMFINSWNEWSEGAHLEPDRRYQRTYLEAIRIAKSERGLFKKYIDEKQSDILISQFNIIKNDLEFQRNNSYFSRLYEGHPSYLDCLPQVSGFKCHIDVANGQHFTSNFILDRKSGINVGGWVISSLEKDMRDSFGIFILKSMGSQNCYFVPVLKFYERRDVADFYRLGNHSALFGFEVRTPKHNITSGVYSASFMQIEDNIIYHHNLNSAFHVF